MALLIAGVALWWGAHLFGRIAPGLRAALGRGPGRAAVAIALLLAIILMHLGYARADAAPLYQPPAWGRHLNNLLMYAAIVLAGMGHAGGRMRGWLRHPMLTAVVVWAAAHLLVRGDGAALVLFGGLALWALVEMAVINRAEPGWTPPAPGPVARDLGLLVAAAVIYAVIVLIHWKVFGLYPFPG
ncbi:MAG: membrane protein [Paracoccaceae bacterium]|nr:MAG: hypothetical protein D6686_03160 [Alphaproteobacteria bacterium]GIX13683.1 MAG: membrane protein [Paracoccaceae bacterium]